MAWPRSSAGGRDGVQALGRVLAGEGQAAPPQVHNPSVQVAGFLTSFPLLVYAGGRDPV
jgi:hypothetical protein